MATQEMYDRVKNLTAEEVVEVARYCCGDMDEEDDFCEQRCPYLDVREGEHNPARFCRQWVMHDLLQILDGIKV